MGKLSVTEEITIFIFACGIMAFTPIYALSDARKNIIKNKSKSNT